MNDFFGNLIGKSFAQAAGVKPRPVPRYAPAPHLAGALAAGGPPPAGGRARSPASRQDAFEPTPVEVERESAALPESAQPMPAAAAFKPLEAWDTSPEPRPVPRVARPPHLAGALTAGGPPAVGGQVRSPASRQDAFAPTPAGVERAPAAQPDAAQKPPAPAGFALEGHAAANSPPGGPAAVPDTGHPRSDAHRDLGRETTAPLTEARPQRSDMTQPTAGDRARQTMPLQPARETSLAGPPPTPDTERSPRAAENRALRPAAVRRPARGPARAGNDEAAGPLPGDALGVPPRPAEPLGRTAAGRALEPGRQERRTASQAAVQAAVEAPPAVADRPAAPQTVPAIKPLRAADTAAIPVRAAADLTPPPAAPAITVTIGRIEVRATAPAATPPPRRQSAAPVMSLEDYLKMRNGGQR